METLRATAVVLLRNRCCCCCYVASVVSDSVQPHRRQPTRLRRPWDSPSKNAGVGCHRVPDWEWQHFRLLFENWIERHVSPLIQMQTGGSQSLPVCPHSVGN